MRSVSLSRTAALAAAAVFAAAATAAAPLTATASANAAGPPIAPATVNATAPAIAPINAGSLATAPAIAPTNAGSLATAPATATSTAAANTSSTNVAPNTLAPPKAPQPCLANGDGYLRAQIRGAMQLDVNLHNGELECEGGPRPNGSGIRVSFAGPIRSDGRRLRMVFGVTTATEGGAGRELPTNLTVIFEGEQRLFATLGDDKCTVDQLSQERVGALGGPVRSYRVIARGFCIAPAKGLNNQQNILVNSFDFAGRVIFEDLDSPVTAPPGTAPPRKDPGSGNRF